MEDASLTKRSTSLIVTLAAIVIILAGVKYAESIISPLLIALFISAISGPAMFWLTEKKVPAGLAVSLIILSIVISGFFISSILGSSLQNFSDKLPEYQARLQEITQSIAITLSQFGIHLELEELRKILNFGKVMSFVSSTFNQVLGALTNIFLILMMVIFLLFELSGFRLKLKNISNNPTQTMASLEHVSGTIGRYFKIKAFTSLITALPIIIVLSIMGIDFPVLWGMVAFSLNFIPNIGSIIAAIPVILLALIQFGFLAAGQVTILYLLMNSLIGSFMEPKLMGHSLGLSTLVVFLSLVFWGWLLGPIGMFLSVPLTMTFKIIMDSQENTRWISILLSNSCLKKNEGEPS
ncbi:MAG: AI-2E family transporter [gamma proteobacterium symbiont of Bathyaustriella thionipta]|nr:AI-2E family transporter [gamma proteobacterium symbiont of Bathyaustriella thionipta]MCU7949204.1 AI-2E family transporter [gamma proteobacterium symbiont of Bathyaustriella thionipta]MCU7954881.1 AI-2E family transporter [gamma proteobacterium symbiont of Bathyaustriella thionipta]MCU7955754.1 AI-2E family transporter [gamma proteobacterium symbiont of Bathyaustriella thionipta]MCU7965656.1 AI-2E family transporter [gamma proteobacterium symbiont of Bathyaustriella thionipta]